MDTQQAELRMADGLAGAAFTVVFVLTLAFGFADFPTHARFIGALLIFVHLGVTSVLVGTRLEHHKAQQLIWFDFLTLQFGLTGLARTIMEKERLDAEQATTLWSNATERAANDALELPDFQRQAIAKMKPKPWKIFSAGVVILVFYYAIAVGIAVLISRLF